VNRNGRSVVENLGCVFVHRGYDRLFLKPDTYIMWREPMDDKPYGIRCITKVNGELMIVIF